MYLFFAKFTQSSLIEIVICSLITKAFKLFCYKFMKQLSYAKKDSEFKMINQNESIIN